jgi:hypothetical protein
MDQFYNYMLKLTSLTGVSLNMALSKLQFSKTELERVLPIKLTSFMEQELKFVFGIFLLAKKSNPKRNPENSPQISTAVKLNSLIYNY